MVSDVVKFVCVAAVLNWVCLRITLRTPRILPSIAQHPQARAVEYQFAHDRPLNVGATAQLLSNTLYYKRFFPYYTANLCIGLDPQGEIPTLLSCVRHT